MSSRFSTSNLKFTPKIRTSSVPRTNNTERSLKFRRIYEDAI
jgi:hypothetical protein